MIVARKERSLHSVTHGTFCFQLRGRLHMRYCEVCRVILACSFVVQVVASRGTANTILFAESALSTTSECCSTSNKRTTVSH
jgi:hypothetical protein